MNETFKQVAISFVTALVVSVVFAVVGGSSQPGNLGANTLTRFPNTTIVAKGFTASATGATSTVKSNCVQTNATSTATNIKLTYQFFATSTIQGTAVGNVTWAYGTCP